MSIKIKALTSSLPIPTLGERITVTGRTYTADDLMELSCDSSRRYELEKGILTIMSPAGSKHGLLAMKIALRLGTYVEEQNAGVVLAAETGFRLTTNPDTVLAPDVAYVARARVPAQGMPSSFFPGPPDLLVEVSSPSDRPADLSAKVGLWLQHGAKLVWVIDPATTTVAVHRANGSTEALTVDDSLDGEDVLPGFRYPLSTLFK